VPHLTLLPHRPHPNLAATAAQTQNGAPVNDRSAVMVEVPGIEPGSFAALSGLLRAQLAVPLLGPTDHASESV
jgi:hypothetical protein